MKPVLAIMNREDKLSMVIGVLLSFGLIMLTLLSKTNLPSLGV